jgi:hypothetical protein
MHMGSARPKVPPDIKRQLADEAGGKCANPGCSNRVTELHHIWVWAAARKHDATHMIALCGGCHDAAHRGILRLDDATLYGWKEILRETPATHDHFYVEPTTNARPRLLLGSIAVQGDRRGVASPNARVAPAGSGLPCTACRRSLGLQRWPPG